MVTRIERDQVRRLAAHGAQIIEVLREEEFAEEHLPGAVNIPLKSLDAARADALDTTHPVVVYCNDTL